MVGGIRTIAILAAALGMANAAPSLAGESVAARACAQEARLAIAPEQAGKSWHAIDPAAATAACAAAYAAHPDEPAIAADYGRALLAAGQRDEARQVLLGAQAVKQGQFSLVMMDLIVEQMSRPAEIEGASAETRIKSATSANGYAMPSRDDGRKSLVELERLAGEGYGPAQLVYGRYLIGGLGVIGQDEHNPLLAQELFRKAAAAGSVEAHHWLGYLYQFGRGVPRDPVEAVRLYGIAADAGHAPSMAAIGQMLRDGSGVVTDAAGGVAWLRRAAAAGDDYAQYLLLEALEQDGETPADALATLERLAAAGNPSAQVELADRLAGSDPERAKALYKSAETRGNLTAPFNPLSPTSGHLAALGITQAFQNLLSQVKIYPAVIGDAQLVFYGKQPSKAESDALIDRMTAKVGQLDVSIAKVLAAKKALAGRPMGLTQAETVAALRKAADGGDVGAAVLLAFPPDTLDARLVDQAERDKWRDWLAKLEAGKRNELATAMTDSIGGNQDFGLVLTGLTGPAEIDDAYEEKARLQTLGKFHLYSLALDRVVTLVTSPKFTAMPLADRLPLIRTLGEGLQSTCAWTASITAFVQQSQMLKEATACNEQSPIFAASPEQLETLLSAGMSPAGLQLAYLYRSGELGNVDNVRAAATLQRVIDDCERRDVELTAGHESEWSGTPGFRCHGETRFAKLMLAALYERGEGVPSDVQLADKLYRQGGSRAGRDIFACPSCSVQSPVAAGGLLRAYIASEGSSLTHEQLVETAAYAARSYDPVAMRSLAYLYLSGKGLARDEAQAMRWLQDAALKSDGEAQLALAMAYDKGVGVARDRKLAARWYLAAAAQRFTPDSAAARTIAPLLTGSSAKAPRVDLGARMAALQTIADRAFAAGNFGTMLQPQLEQVTEYHRLAGDADAMIASRLKVLTVSDAALVEKHGTMKNYFALLNSSCQWGRASLEAYKAERPEAALYFAKVSVNKLQQARGYIDQLDKNLRECFLKVHQDRYRWLADLLMEMGRFPEAEQVLGMLKDFEFREFTRASGTEGDNRLEFSKAETPTEYRRSALSDEIAKASQIAATIGAKKAGQRSEAETAQLLSARDSLAQANTAYNQHFEALKAEVAALDRGGDTAEPGASPDWKTGATRQIVVELRDHFGPETAALHAVLTPTRIHWLISTSNIQRAIAIDIGAAELQREVGQFRAALTGRSADANARAAALYKRIFAPVDEELRKLGKTTVLLSLDGSLRYVPFAALSDGKDWLVKRYSFSTFRDVQYLGTGRKVPEDWRIAGFGVTREAKVARTTFAPLPAVAHELEAIAGAKTGVAPGTVMLDDQFDRTALTNALKSEVPIVHLATHFKLAPDNDESMLLLGKNEGLKLTEFKVNGSYDLSYVDLLALSACETAIGARAISGAGLDTNAGKELDGMGQIAQDAGAASVLASLWAVNDSSTAQLMRNFYVNRIQKGLSKTEALRAVQLAFLDGSIVASGDGTGSRRPGIEAEGGPAPVSTDWNHPYYWAPFLLMGNVS